MNYDHILALIGILVLLVSLYLLEKIPIIELLLDMLRALVHELVEFFKHLVNPGRPITLPVINFIGFILVFFYGISVMFFNVLHEEVGFLMKLISSAIKIDIHLQHSKTFDLFLFNSIFIIVLAIILIASMFMVRFHDNNMKQIKENIT